jgi:ParB family chromosome partitioning protein
MTVQSNASAIRGIPLGQLILSQLNVRKQTSETGIAELAALIEAEGVLQNLATFEGKAGNGKRGKVYEVVAGGRRWRALQLLLKAKKITPAYSVPCLVTTVERAVSVSLAENSGVEALHPADQFEAFRALVDAGQTVEHVAAQFGVMPLVVQRRLKLANVCPDFIQMYRDGNATLEHLMALSVTDDHDRQRDAWNGLPAYQRTPSDLRRVLTEGEISARDPIARFVGRKAYEKAGGQCRRDLFSTEDEVFYQDTELLRRLAQEKLTKHATELTADGHAWIDVVPHLDYSARARYQPIDQVLRDPTKKEQHKLDMLNERLAQVEAQAAACEGDEDQAEKLESQANELEEALEAIRTAQLIPNPEQQPLAGAVVSIDRDGKLKVETGLLRPDAVKRPVAADPQHDGEDGEEGPRAHSAALLLRLTAHRTLALRAELARKPEIALAALAHRLILGEFFANGHVYESALQMDTRAVPLDRLASDLAGSKAQASLEANRERLRARLPADAAGLFDWILRQSQADVIELVGFCVSQSIDAVTNHEGESAADALASAVHMDMRQWWTPTVEGYFGSVTRAVILSAITEGDSAEAAAAVEALKKAPLAEAAERTLMTKGWLPTVLRGSWAA